MTDLAFNVCLHLWSCFNPEVPSSSRFTTCHSLKLIIVLITEKIRCHLIKEFRCVSQYQTYLSEVSSIRTPYVNTRKT